MQTTSRMTLITVTLASALLVSACGNSKGERALSGGAIGAGVGGLGAAVLAADPVTGAIIGGAAGAVTGAATDKDDINFGDIN
jgi:osmotically inducible lipoprotein OsmB